MSETLTVEACLNDPMQYMAPLPYRERFYAMGFPVDVATDSREVLSAARESWGVYQPRFDRPPLQVNVMVRAGSRHPQNPVLCGQGHLMTWVSDAENFAVCDRRQRFAYACVNEANLADRVFFRWHFFDSLVYILLELNYVTSIHAACIAWQNEGVLLYADSGTGKSTVCYACAKDGWTYLSDDGSSILWDSPLTVIGEPHHFRFREDAPRLFPELAGLTVGRQLDHKPTIEVYTAGLPLRTADECRASHVVFLRREPGARAGVRQVSIEETRDRLRRDLAVFDPELQDYRLGIIDSVAGLPAYELSFSHYPEAVASLNALVGRAVC